MLKLKLLLPIALSITLMAGFILLVNPSSDPNSPPDFDDGETISSSNSDNESPVSEPAQPSFKPNTGQSSPNNQSINPTKHQSTILQENPQAIEYEYYLMATVNDPSHGSSWDHATIQTDRAWDVTTGSSSITVAVIDSPFALNHEDLTDKWSINTGEQGNTQDGDDCWTGSPADKQTNGCDDDGNGYVDDWRGYDFINDDNNVQAGLTNPTGEGVSHGSLVAGTVAASANNSKGSAGVDQSASIMPLQVFDDDGNATTTDIVAAVEYAVDNGADVINLSLGSNGNDPLLLAAIKEARAQNIMVVAAAGNCALNDEPICNALTPPGRMLYPAYNRETIAVGATSSSDTRASFSSYGPELDIVAPGVSVGPLPTYTQANPTSAYATASGTSFSAPITSGIAALIKAEDPTITLLEWEYSLYESVEKVSGMGSSFYTNYYGFGRVNAHRATVLAKAKSESLTLNATELSTSQPAAGQLWRAYDSGNVADDESILIGCKVSSSDRCTATIQNGSIYSFSFGLQHKTGPIRYFFVKGTDVPSGTWNIAVNDRDYSYSLGTLTR